MAWLTALWLIIVAYWPTVGMTIVIPFFVAFVAQCPWPSWVKELIGVVVSLCVGVLGAFIAGIPLTPDTLLVFFTAVFTGYKLAYRLFANVGITCAWMDKLLMAGECHLMGGSEAAGVYQSVGPLGFALIVMALLLFMFVGAFLAFIKWNSENTVPKSVYDRACDCFEAKLDDHRLATEGGRGGHR